MPTVWSLRLPDLGHRPRREPASVASRSLVVAPLRSSQYSFVPFCVASMVPFARIRFTLVKSRSGINRE